jgi:hypothetical protein
VRLCENPPRNTQRRTHTIGLDQSALLELSAALRSADSGELMRRLLHTVLQSLIDAEATAHIGAGPHERTETRTTQRNGTRDKVVATTAGDLTVKTPKVSSGLERPVRQPPVAHAFFREEVEERDAAFSSGSALRQPLGMAGNGRPAREPLLACRRLGTT